MLSTHTHSGPATGILRGCGEVDAEYVSKLSERLIRAGKEALQRVNKVKNARHFSWNFGGIGYNRVLRDSGPIDN